MEKVRDIGEISEEFQPLLNHALEMMNEQPFEYYLSWEGRRMDGNDLGFVQFYPLYVVLGTKDDKKLRIDIDVCKKIFLGQGKKTFIQESLF